MSALFPDIPACGTGFQPVKSLARRREVVQCATNARGRSKLTIDYQPKINWKTDDVVAIERILRHYFHVFGCFRIIDDRLMKAWMRKLELYCLDELRWALSAKRKSMEATQLQDAAFKRQFAVGPDRFLDKLDYWLNQSPDYHKWCDTDRAHEGADARAVAWNLLTPDQRQLARTKTFAQFKRACAMTTGADGQPLDPDHVAADPLQIDIALRFARGQGWIQRSERERE